MAARDELRAQQQLALDPADPATSDQSTGISRRTWCNGCLTQRAETAEAILATIGIFDAKKFALY